MADMHDLPAGQPDLRAALHALAAADAAYGASAGVERRLVDEVRRIRRGRRRTLLKMSIIASALGAATTLPVWQLVTSDLRRPATARSQRMPALPKEETVTEFFPLSYSTVPMSGGRLVRLEVPREAMIAFGVDTVDAIDSNLAPTAMVIADVFVGDDGLARAVRFVRPMSPNRQREAAQ